MFERSWVRILALYTGWTLMCCKKLYCLLEKAENKRKRGLGWHIKKYYLISLMSEIASLGSIYTTLAVAIERYVSVCHPHYSPSHCSAGFAIVTLILFSVLFNICRFLEFETTYEYAVRTSFKRRICLALCLTLSIIFFKKWAIPGPFSLIFVFSIYLTINKCSI